MFQLALNFFVVSTTKNLFGADIGDKARFFMLVVSQQHLSQLQKGFQLYLIQKKLFNAI
jgi:hypothetical protein